MRLRSFIGDMGCFYFSAIWSADSADIGQLWPSHHLLILRYVLTLQPDMDQFKQRLLSGCTTPRARTADKYWVTIESTTRSKPKVHASAEFVFLTPRRKNFCVPGRRFGIYRFFFYFPSCVFSDGHSLGRWCLLHSPISPKWTSYCCCTLIWPNINYNYWRFFFIYCLNILSSTFIATKLQNVIGINVLCNNVPGWKQHHNTEF